MRSNFIFDSLALLLTSKQGVQTVWAASILTPFMAQFPEHVPLVAFSGLCGGMARWIADRQRLWPVGMGTIAMGGLTATFLWPVARPLTEGVMGKTDMDPGTALMFGGFVSGVFGVTLIGLMLDIVHSKRRRIEENSND